MRRFIFASHHELAKGLKDTVNFLTSNSKEIIDINAYLSDNEEPLENIVKNLFDKFDNDDEVIVLTDLMGGSVYQKFYPYISERVHVICGMNLPLAMHIVLSDNSPFTSIKINNIISECKEQIIYVNQIESSADEDDE